ncbi:MAG: V-type ATP synthase subunit D [bacterium]|nr:V-type ATP synthase subunit D [bacterium]MDD5756266.1 V-type ATP synthase subunit D [bacterium]
MRLNVNPTRMELLKLRRRTAIARRGHKLLKDKQDELMRIFMELINKLRDSRREVEKSLQEATASYILNKAQMGENTIDQLWDGLKAEVEVIWAWEPLMNLQLPRYQIAVKTQDISYGYLQPTLALDQMTEQYKNLLVQLVALAEQEKIIKLLAEEIGKTRRRVNALEYILIPNLIETMRYINMKLTEHERGTVTRLMRIKDIVHKTH